MKRFMGGKVLKSVIAMTLTAAMLTGCGASASTGEAKGEAEAIRIQTEAIRSQGGAEYVKLKWIEKWNGRPPQFVSGAGASQFMIDVRNTEQLEPTK